MLNAPPQSRDDKIGGTTALERPQADSSVLDCIQTAFEATHQTQPLSVWKRSFDLAFSCTVITLALPVMAVIVCLIWLTSPGPVLFRQRRVGRGGRLFTIYKFRTMHKTANPYASSPDSDFKDTRVTSVGKLLRKTGLDELPQFVNVLRGEMSVVGPRPEMPFWVKQYTPRQLGRLQVLPGITGLWQISPARKDQIHENLQYDFYYIRHQSVWLDIWLVYRTFRAMFRVRRSDSK